MCNCLHNVPASCTFTRCTMAVQRRTVPLYQVDAFTSEPFAGNPAAVCLLRETLDAELMQQIAAEMNLSETAFVEPANTNGSNNTDAFAEGAHFKLRWFTPVKEVQFCGHATLATAATLFQEGNQQDVLHFETLSGRLSVGRDKSVNSLSLQMDCPADPPKASLPAWLQNVTAELKATFKGVQVQDIQFPEKLDYVLVALASSTTQQQLEDMRVDARQLESLADRKNITGVIVTCSGDGKPYHFLSRFFAPWGGIDEDPVTGSAHTILGPYWASQLQNAPQTMQARQCSPRGGDVQVTVDNSKGRVTVAGQAVTVSKGVLYLPT